MDRCLDGSKFCLLDVKNASELSGKKIGHVRIGVFATPSISQADKIQQTAIHVHKDGRGTIPYRRATHQATDLNKLFHVCIYIYVHNVNHDDLQTFLHKEIVQIQYCFSIFPRTSTYELHLSRCRPSHSRMKAVCIICLSNPAQPSSKDVGFRSCTFSNQ